MSVSDTLGDRMKSNYESAYDLRLPMRMPVIVRVDGRAFHTLTRDMEKPFDDTFIDIMNRVAIEMCQNISGCQCAFVQSDEISILIHNYKRLNSSAWFDNSVQKMVSVSAAMATAKFNSIYRCLKMLAHFDARVFVLPEAEVTNYFIWRQNDAARNSIQMLARSFYSHNELLNKNTKDLQDMVENAGSSWSDLHSWKKRGRLIIDGYPDIDQSYNKGYTVLGDPLSNPGFPQWGVCEETKRFSENRSIIEDLLKTLPE